MDHLSRIARAKLKRPRIPSGGKGTRISDPNLSLSEEEAPAKAAQRYRRERCNARHRNRVGSFNLNAETPSPPLDSGTTTHCYDRPALNLTRRSPSARADLSSDKERLESWIPSLRIQ